MAIWTGEDGKAGSSSALGMDMGGRVLGCPDAQGRDGLRRG
ncbi:MULTISPECIES: hypothetical protein [Paracoccus]|nr:MULTISPECIES: hypothetical protein [Paracoccus]